MPFPEDQTRLNLTRLGASHFADSSEIGALESLGKSSPTRLQLAGMSLLVGFIGGGWGSGWRVLYSSRGLGTFQASGFMLRRL